MVELECLRGVSIGLPTKYQALLIFCLFSSNNGFAWLMFDPVSGELEDTFSGMSDLQIEILSSWQPVVYIAAFFPILRLVTRPDGLRRSVRLGATCELVGAALKLLAVLVHSSPVALYILHLGQIFSAVSSPVAIGAVSQLSAQWFEPHERTRATAAAVLSNNVGNAICYLLVPALTSAIGYDAVTIYELIMAGIACFFAWLVMPGARAARQVQTVPGHEDESDEAPPILPQLKEMLSHKSAILLLLVYSWSSGGYVAWTSLFDTMLGDYYSSQYIGTVSFAGTVGYVIGGLVSSYLTDLYFYRHMKHVIFVCMALNTVSCIFFIASVPDEDGTILWPLGQVWIVFVASLCGLWNGAAAPIFYELVAEITYPVDEGVSGNIMSMCENLGALVLYQGVARAFEAQSMNYAFAGGMAVTIALSSMIDQRYNRSYAVLASNMNEGVMVMGDEEEQPATRASTATVMSKQLETVALFHEASPERKTTYQTRDMN